MAIITDVAEVWWDFLRVPEEGCCQWQLGCTTVWAKRLGQDLAVASSSDDEEQPQAVVGTTAGYPENDPGWQRWIIGSDEPRLRVVPALTTMPVVVRPQQPLMIAPRVSVRLFVGIAAVLRLQLPRGPQPVAPAPEKTRDDAYITLLEAPAVPLSQTWFGDNMAGELSLSVTSRARRNLDDVDHLPHRILCPLQVTNDSDESFAFERACVRLPHCGVYHGSGRLWSSASLITYRGPDQDNVLEVENHPPKEAPTATMVSPPREPGGTKGGRFSLAGLRGAWMST